ncbi:MAG: hypothetical protein KGH60_04355 [Candidatus Micrarchaeota archaeon]|nr:hypothetical protein [Candidatus Micrarchaeota archaeon]
MLSDKVMAIIRDGSVIIRVKRTGMFQQMTFKIKRVDAGRDKFVELFCDRLIDMSELERVANDTGLPVEAQNGRAFPEGLGAKDFLNL